jgi:phage tail-like protein
LPRFRFEVRWDSAVMHFQEVSGLDAEAQPIEYRHGDSPQFSAVKMPGLKKFSDVTMKKGVFRGPARTRTHSPEDLDRPPS